MKILFFGDIVGKLGRRAVEELVPKLKRELEPDLIIANAENAAHGIGVTPKIVEQLLAMGIDFLTSGNHIFDKVEQMAEVFNRFSDRIVRPMNFQGDYPGLGWGQIEVKGKTVVIANFNAQVFMERQFKGLIGSPFVSLDEFLQKAPKGAIIIVDFHSEASSEKRAFGWYADGKVSAILGTHTHVQTADAQVLPGGTAYISDVGMCGAAESVLGVNKDLAIKRFLSAESVKLDVVEEGQAEAGYALIEIDEETKKAKSIKSFLERT